MKLILAVVVSAAAWVATPAQMQIGSPQQRDVTQPQMRPMPVGTASVSGTVTAADGGKPLRDARVSITGAATIPDGVIPAAINASASTAPISMAGTVLSRSVTTDASGRFAFPKLPAGHFTLSVGKSNYLSASYGQKRPNAPGATILIADGQSFTANMTLMRGGVISGAVFGTDGEPLRAQVSAWRYQVVGGVRRPIQNNSVTTDDRGQYRLTNLQPGDYLVSVTSNNFESQMASRMNPEAAAVEQAILSAPVRPPTSPGMPATVLVPAPSQQTMTSFEPPAFLPTYFPGTSSRATAQIIRVTGGDEHPGTDITAVNTEAGTIVATLTSPMKPGLTVRANLIGDEPAFDNTSYSLDPTNKVTFRAVPPGTYTVMFQTQAQFANRGGGPPSTFSDDDRLWGSAVVTVSGNFPVTASITMQPSRSISGIVLFDMARPPDLSRQKMSVTVSSVTQFTQFGPLPQGTLEVDGRFSVRGVPPGKYTLRLNGAPTLKSAIVGNVDILDVPLEFGSTEDVSGVVLTVSDKFNELSGTLTDASGKPGIDYTVIAATSDERFWSGASRRISVARTSADGKYTFRTLPPGDYYVVVLSDFEQGTQYDPEFLRSLPGIGTRIRINEGAKTTQDLRVK